MTPEAKEFFNKLLAAKLDIFKRCTIELSQYKEFTDQVSPSGVFTTKTTHTVVGFHLINITEAAPQLQMWVVQESGLQAR